MPAEAVEHRLAQLPDIVRPTGAEPQRGRTLRNVSGELDLVHVDADAERDVPDAAVRVRRGVGKDARDLAARDQHVVRGPNVRAHPGGLLERVADRARSHEGEL